MYQTSTYGILLNVDDFKLHVEPLFRAANRELYQEFTRRNQQRRLRLRPCLIQIQPTNQFWGSWNARTRQITIAQKLITDYEWHDVVGVLCHEMAHQVVDETPAKGTQKAHGDAFQKACQRVGVPFYYAKAQVHLHQHTLDWRQTQPSSEEEKRLEKIRKLLNLASSSNENEASVAMNRVREIYARYNLEQSASVSDEFYHAFIKTNRKRLHTYEQKIMGILVSHYMVEVIVGSAYSSQHQSYLRTIELIGRKENVLMAEYVFDFLKRFTLDKVAEKKSREKFFPAALAKSYHLGLLTGFDEKLTQQIELEENDHIKKSLVIFAKDPNIQDYISKVHPRLIRVASQARLGSKDFFETGRKDGQKLTIHKPIEHKSSKKLFGLLT